jgi:hypothetical protein
MDFAADPDLSGRCEENLFFSLNSGFLSYSREDRDLIIFLDDKFISGIIRG